jgi:hypothetical protein
LFVAIWMTRAMRASGFGVSKAAISGNSRWISRLLVRLLPTSAADQIVSGGRRATVSP